VSVALATLAAGPRPLVAQQQQGTQAQQVDSTKIEAQNLLKSLARPPGADSLLYLQDSIAKAQRLQRRPGMPGGGAHVDSTVLALSRMPGYSLTEYQGSSASYDARDRILRLKGQGGQSQASVTQPGGQEMKADSSIVYYENTGMLETHGGVTTTPPPGQGDPLTSSALIFDTKKGYGTALNAKTTYKQQMGGGASWIVSGDMPLASADSSFISPADFTSCDLTPPHYHFETDQIKIVAGKILVARPVRLYFADVPVAWLPFIAQSLSRGRASGILTPLFSVNDIVRTSSGYHRRISNIGYYWAMSQYSDASVALDWFSGNWLSLTGDFRYKVNKQFLSGNLNLRRYWQASGSRQLSLSTSNSWAPDERTQVRISGQYASSANFVRQNTFDPQEVTQSISSQGGINRRFDWGTLSLSANRRQYLSDNRVEWTLPSADLSLSTITLFKAAPSQAHFWNNMTWSGHASATRSTVDRLAPDTFSLSSASTADRRASASSNLSMGNLTLSQNIQLDQKTIRAMPDAYIALGDTAPADSLLRGAPSRDVTDATVNWSTSLGYQQHLIGSTTVTPSLSFSGQMFRSDTSSLAGSYVSAPSRLSVGVSLNTDLYGFYPGFGSYQAIRHKLSPSFSFSWSPQVTPTSLQSQIFHSQGSRAQKTVAITLRQTFEAKGKAPKDSTKAAADTTGAGAGGLGEEPASEPKAPITTLLALSTSVVNYDFMQADSLGFFSAGFTTTQLQNQISSDFLRGLNISISHDLFKDTKNAQGQLVSRKFSPHLSSMNLSFSLGSQSSIFRWLGFLSHGNKGADTTAAAEPQQDTTPIASEALSNQASVIPTSQRTRPALMGGSTGGWRAQLSYALQRPRGATASQKSQMLQISLSMKPTQHWDMRWRTSYDLERGKFNDHTISLTRDLHRWRANFDFFQTATGNWTFRFEVSLIDNRDLKFNYSQNSLDFGQQTGGR
jgi:hypothetical protein